MTLSVAEPDPDDPTIARARRPCLVGLDARELLHARRRSRARRRAELRLAALRLRRHRDGISSPGQSSASASDPASRSATITTFEPLLDTTYIPCVSMLDFWAPAGALELVVYAHSLDFGKKAYGNLVELARLQALVAGELDLPVGRSRST